MRDQDWGYRQQPNAHSKIAERRTSMFRRAPAGYKEYLSHESLFTLSLQLPHLPPGPIGTLSGCIGSLPSIQPVGQLATRKVLPKGLTPLWQLNPSFLKGKVNPIIKVYTNMILFKG
jgi:hypothetical protein